MIAQHVRLKQSVNIENLTLNYGKVIKIHQKKEKGIVAFIENREVFISNEFFEWYIAWGEPYGFLDDSF